MGKVIRFGPKENIQDLERSLKECVGLLEELLDPVKYGVRGYNSLEGHVELMVSIHHALGNAYSALDFSRTFDTLGQLEKLGETPPKAGESR